MFIEITDVYLRDGLQDEHVVVSTEDKLRIAAGLHQAGVTRLEAGSFVNPKRVPQMADAAELFARKPEISATWTALALNGRGIDRAVAAGADEIQIVASASEAHSSANAGGSTAKMVADLGGTVAKYASRTGVRFFAGISTAFVCPFEGDIAPERLIEVVGHFTRLGLKNIGLADTLGSATPEQVLASVAAVQEAEPDITLSLHLHNAHGRALETVTAAVELGITRFDSALGGFGGCPFAPGAAGNLDTLDLVRHLHSLGLETGIDETQLCELTELSRRVVRQSEPVNI